MERTKLKNKVPLLRHERFSKTNFGNGGKYNDYLYKNGYYNMNTYKSMNPLDLLIPISSKANHFNTIELTTTLPRDSMELNTFKKILLTEDRQSPSTFPKFAFNAPCCKNGQMSCKQCTSPKDYSRSRLEPRMSPYSDEKKPDTENKFTELTDDALNIRIKIDVQLPKLHERLDKQQNVFDLNDGSNTKDFPLAIKMPTSYYNFPIPMNLFGYKKRSKLNSSPLHKITMHRKKKSKSNTGGKKHRKKIITFHNIKLEPQQIYEAHFGKPNVSEGNTKYDLSTVADLVTSTTKNIETNITSTTLIPLEKINNETQTEENIFLVVNISNNVVNETEESNKTNNSIETDYTNAILKSTTDNSLHLIKKREAIAPNGTFAVSNKTVALNKTVPQAKPVLNVTKALKDTAKRVDKGLISDDELLYWPNINGSLSKIIPKNITTIILESETKKTKLNMTKEAMRRNRTRTLEKAIFGDADWNDVDTVVPAFISFIGKYIQGALTFCSNNICHSMKCGQKVCHHRVCVPIDRLNNKGHCIGANNTGKSISNSSLASARTYINKRVPINNKTFILSDSVATMESIMDLPSNVAFEIVDILQDKMAGKLFGKVTLCISAKCITFAASKKLFIKNKCIIKELNPKGHCVNSKEGKIA